MHESAQRQIQALPGKEQLITFAGRLLEWLNRDLNPRGEPLTDRAYRAAAQRAVRALPVADHMADRSHCYLWVPNALLLWTLSTVNTALIGLMATVSVGVLVSGLERESEGRLRAETERRHGQQLEALGTLAARVKGWINFARFGNSVGLRRAILGRPVVAR